MTSRFNGDRDLVPSLLDRLLDDEPHVARDTVSKRYANIAEFKRCVMRDLEILLNTRQELNAAALAPEDVGLLDSVLGYGLPDFTARGLLGTEDRREMQRELQRAIENGDKRLINVHVQLLDQDSFTRTLRFKVNAVLRLNRLARPIAFDAIWQVGTQQYQVTNVN